MLTHLRSGLIVGLVAGLSTAIGACFSSNDNRPGPDASLEATPGDDATTDSPGEPSVEGSVDAAADVSSDTSAPPDAAGEGSADSQGDALVDAPQDAGPEAAAPGVYVDPINGLDTNPGTAALPFKTIYHATIALDAPDAGAGQTVYLADGTYDSTNQTNFWGSFTRPTFVRGSAAGNVILKGNYTGEVMYFAQGGGISNVTFRNTSYSFQAQGGTFAASGVTLDGLPQFNGWGMSFVNGAVGTIDTLGIVNMNSAGGQDIGAILYADNTANVTWHAGTTTITSPAASPGNAIFARGAAQLAIDGLTLTNYPGFAVVLYDQAQLALSNSTITGSGPAPGICSATGCRASIWMGGSQTGAPTGTLTLNGTTISGSPGSAVGYSTTSNTAAVNLTMTNSHLDNNAYSGLWIGGNTNAALAINVTATGTTFSGNAMSGITAGPKATISLTGGAVSNNGAGAAALSQTPGGVVMQDGASPNSLKMRNVTLAGNTGSAITFAGNASSTLDLGTAASLGGSTFSGVTGSYSALNLTALIVGSAIGNTWMPSVQGSDSSGHYTTTTTITGAAAGLNVTASSGASVVLQ